MLTPREHPHFFAKQLLPTHTFRSPDTMFAELTGPKREAFLMHLWQEAAKATGSALPHVAIADGKLSKLEVVGAQKRGGVEVVVLSMPPAENPGEAVFIALVRKSDGVSVFFLERCANADHTAGQLAAGDGSPGGLAGQVDGAGPGLHRCVDVVHGLGLLYHGRRVWPAVVHREVGESTYVIGPRDRAGQGAPYIVRQTGR